MKTILYFIGLKVAEISGVFVAWWALCHLGVYLCLLIDNTAEPLPFWGAALLPIIIVMGGFLVCCLMYLFISENWEKAKRLSRK